MNTNQRKLIAAMTLCAAVSIPNIASAATITMQMSGTVTQQEQFIPGTPPGTPWYLSLSFDSSQIIKYSEIPEYNAAYLVQLLSGEYGLGAESSPLDELFLVVFYQLPLNGFAELDIHLQFQNMTQLSIVLSDSSGQAITGFEFPEPSNFTLSSYDTRFAHFDEDSPLVNGLLGGAYRHATVDSLSAISAVPVPTAAWLFGSGLLGLVGMSRKRRR